MPPLVAVAIAAIASAIPLLYWTLSRNSIPGRDAVQENLTRGLASRKQTENKRGQRFDALASRFTPGSFVARLERQLALAGRPAAWPVKRLMTAKIMLAAAAAILGVLFIAGSPGMKSLLLAAGFTLVVYFVPDLLLYSKGAERQTAIGLELPDTLDQMTIAVEAGLGFDAAMARAGQNGKGPLSEELIRTLQDMQVGRSRREAYTDLANRTTSQDLRRFVRAILQADMYGISISSVLRTQAAEMRLKRRQRAEEKAMKIPVKVLFPLMVCILPVLFIAVLGPTVINLVDTLSQ